VLKKLLFFFTATFFLSVSLTDPSWCKEPVQGKSLQSSDTITIFMSGDVMTGRGIDQVLPHSNNPRIHESYMKSARGYVELAERVNGPIKKPVSCSYIWGDALWEWERLKPDVRIINLETSITSSDEYWRGKAVHYRMHPGNVQCLAAAGIDFCSLANNHVLDWGYSGLTETLETLKKVNVKFSGAGENREEAEAPAVLDVQSKGRVIVLSYGSITSGIPRQWAASRNRAGVSFLRDFSDRAVMRIKKKVEEVKRKRDIVVFSIHWGGNWGYGVPKDQRKFAHKLIDEAGIDIIHGHSSHHVKGIEVYNDKLILYGSGDFLTDYEGITGYENFRDDLGLMYFAGVNTSSGKLIRLQMVPTQIKRFRVNKALRADAQWLRDVLKREGRKFGTRIELQRDNTLLLRWD
jgi:poly-gamma-glutamate synthesis protein (capsule biosynthesis protein)